MENIIKKKIKLFMKDKRGLEDSFKFLIFSFIVVSLFAMILFTIIIAQGSTYGKDSNEVLYGMNVSALNSTVNGFQTQADSWRATLGTNSSGIFTQPIGVVTTALDSIGFIATAMFTMVITPFSVLSGIMVNVLGVPEWIVLVIEALVIIAGIFGLIRLFKWGS